MSIGRTASTVSSRHQVKQAHALFKPGVAPSLDHRTRLEVVEPGLCQQGHQGRTESRHAGVEFRRGYAASAYHAVADFPAAVFEKNRRNAGSATSSSAPSGVKRGPKRDVEIADATIE